MVLTLDIYNPLMPEDDNPHGSVQLAVRVLTRRGEVVIDFEEFGDLTGYRDNLSVEGASGSFSISMKADANNEALLRRLHSGMVVEVYAARNANPLEGVIRDPSQIKRVDTTPDLSFIPTDQPVTVSSGALSSGASVGTGNFSAAGPAPPAGTYGGVELDAEQLNNAQIIAEVGAEVGASQRDVQIAIATAMQESSLRNINYGDRDSLGLFQQRPGIGWGTESQLVDPRYAARAFYQGVDTPRGRIPGLFDNDSRNSQSLTQAAQWVQRSAYPDEYAKWEAMSGEVTQSVQSGAGSSAATPAQDTEAPTEQASDVAEPQEAVPVSPVIESQQTHKYQTLTAAQRYGASRDGGNRRHAGVDLDISGDMTAIAFLGGVCTRVDRDPGGYWDYVDLYNEALGIVERIAEYKNPLGIKEGDVVRPGQAVGRGEITCPSGGSCGVIHYELQQPNENRQGQSGYGTSTDPVAFLRNQGIDLYAEPDKVFQNARVVTGGVAPSPTGGGASTATVAIPPIEVEGAIVEPVPDYYLDKCPYLLMHGIIKDFGQTDSLQAGTDLTISGESYGKIYKDATILLDSNAPSTVGHAFEIRTRALYPTAVSFIYYQVLRNWVEVFWGHGMGWEARTRVIPIPPNYMTRINEGSAWSALQFLAIPGFFHLFCDHTGAVVWEKLPWSSKDHALIDGRNWEDLPIKDLPSWKILNWDERLSESGITNFLRVVPTFQHAGGGQPGAVPAMCYNVGSMRQYGGAQKKELQVPMGTHPDQWYTSSDRRQSEASSQTFQDLVVLEAIRWEDRPVQLCNAQVRGEAGWRIHTRVRVTEDWRGEVEPGEYYVTSRGHSIDPAQGRWVTQLALVRDRRTRYLGIGNGTARIIEALPEEPGDYPPVELAPDEYWFFDRNVPGVVAIGNDPIAYADGSIVPRIGQEGDVQTSTPPTTDTNQEKPNEGGEVEEPAEVKSPQLETDNPPGAYTFTLERDGERLTEVPSPINGRVTGAGRTDDYGNFVEVKGSDGVTWRMSHLDSRGVVLGQRVSRGTPLGNQGSTGFAENAHTLVELRRTRRGRSHTITDRETTRPLIDEYLEFVGG